MANPDISGASYTGGNIVLHSTTTNENFPAKYTGTLPVQPADLTAATTALQAHFDAQIAALQAHIDAQVTALQTAIAAIAKTLATKPAGIDFDPSTGGSWLWLAPPGVTAPATTPNGTKLTGSVLQLLTS